VDEQSIFLQALDTPAGESRAGWLDKVCGVGSPLRERIEALLRRHEQANSFLERPAAELGETLGTDTSGNNLAVSLDTGLGPALGNDEAVVPGSAGLSVLRMLAHTIDVPHVLLRESEAEGFEPILRPSSSEIPNSAADSRYQLQGEIARGGMGIIIKGRDTDLGRDLAIKVLLDHHKDKPDVIQRFIEEAQIAGQLQHPGIAPVYELGQFADRRPFFSMKLVKGETLAKLLTGRSDPAADRGRFVGIFEQVCQTMAYAHSRGVIHRDLKPANIMVGAFGEVQVMDWGLAKVLPAGGIADEKKSLQKQEEQSIVQTLRSGVGSDSPAMFGSAGSETQAGSVMGTPSYMPPEQALGEIDNLDERADVFGLGAILCEILTGKPPYVADDGTQLFRMASRAKLADCFARLDACGAEAELIALTKQCLELKPADRPRDASVLAAEVSGYLESVEAKLRKTEIDKVATQAHAEESVRRHKLIHVAGTAVTMSLVIGIAASAWQTVRANREATKAEAEARLTRKAEQAANELATAEAAAKLLAQQEAQRAQAATERAEEQLERSEWLIYSGKLMLAQTDFETGNGGLALHYLNECQVNRRGWEHRYLWTRINAKQTLVGHTGDVRSVAFSPDGKRIITASFDGTARVWDAETGQEVLSLRGHTHQVHSAAFSLDGKYLVTGAGRWGAGKQPNETKVWDARTGKALLDLTGHTYCVWAVAFSPDGKRIITGAGDWAYGPGEVKVWDAETGHAVFDLKGHEHGVRGVAYSPNGKHFVTGSHDGTAKVWDAETGQQVLTLKGRTASLSSVVFSPDGKRIVTAGGRQGLPFGVVKFWDAVTGKEVQVIEGHEGHVSSVAFSLNGKRVVTGSWDQTAKVWDTETGRKLLVLKGHAGYVCSVAFSPDGKRIVTGGQDSTAKVWDAENGQEVPLLKGHKNGVTSIAFSPDSRRFVTGSLDCTAKVWDAETRTEALVLGAPGSGGWRVAGVWSVAVSADGKRILTGSNDRTAKVWDATTGQEILVLTGHAAAVRAVAFSPDGKHIVTGAGEWDKPGPGEAKVWDAGTGQEILALKGHAGVVTSVAFSHDGRRIVTGSNDKTARAWDAETGQELFAFKGHTGRVTSVAISPDGERVVTGSNDRTAKAWDADTGQELLAFQGHTDEVTSVAFSPDGERVVTGGNDGTAKLWDAATGQEVLTLKGHTNMVWSVAFSPNGKYIVTGIAGENATARLWCAEKGQEVHVLKGHTDAVASVAFSPDGNRIFAWDTQENVLAWLAADGKPIDPINPPAAPPPGSARSPDGFRHAQPQGNVIVVTDERPPPKDNVWLLPNTLPVQ